MLLKVDQTGRTRVANQMCPVLRVNHQTSKMWDDD